MRVHTLFGLIALTSLAACAASSGRDGFDDAKPGPTEPAPTPPDGDFGKGTTPPDQKPAEIAEVFGHSEKSLFRLDPKTKAVTLVGDFSGCGSVIDIALDESSNFFATSYKALYKVDKATAKCTEVATSTEDFPNSLSFVPKGTVDPNEEALVGFVGDEYFRIDVKTGARTKLGNLGDAALVSSGDVVSVKGGATYLTVKSERKGNACEKVDCLVELDPKTGRITKRWGGIEHADVFGLSFWAGSIYGFDKTGELFEVTFGTNQLATKTISMQKPAGLSFWGAGSTTSAPVVAQPL